MAASSTDSSTVVVDGSHALSSKITKFGAEFFEKLCAAGNGAATDSCFVSPLSLYLALAMAAGGAVGETKAEMYRVLGSSDCKAIDAPASELDESCAKLLEWLQSCDPSVTLTISNSLWSKASPKPEFSDMLKKYHNAAAFPLKSAAEVNAWVSTATRGLIAHVLDAVPPAMTNVLLNAVYFKGVWTSQFKAADTTVQPFTLADGSKTDCHLMTQHFKSCAYLHTPAYQAVRLGYGTKNAFAAVLVLPNQTGAAALDDVIAKLCGGGGAGLSPLLSSSFGRSMEGTVSLPRFKMSWGLHDVRHTLESLGMLKCFTPAADFSRIAAEPIMISDVLHKTVLEVNEEGTVAAAVTAVKFMRCAVHKKEPTFAFVADRPFLILLVDHAHGTVMFLGKIMRP